jgi:hemerythrin superfamily protein
MAKKPRSGKEEGGASGSLDALQLLESQHRAVEKLFQSIEGASGKDAQALALQVIDKLTVHTIIEERHLYPAIRNGDTEELIDDAYEDHREIKEVCLHLLDIDPADEDYQAKTEELRGLFEEHVSIEESELFPMVREVLDDNQLQALAQHMIATMAELEEEGVATRDQLALDLGELRE